MEEIFNQNDETHILFPSSPVTATMTHVTVSASSLLPLQENQIDLPVCIFSMLLDIFSQKIKP